MPLRAQSDGHAGGHSCGRGSLPTPCVTRDETSPCTIPLSCRSLSGVPTPQVPPERTEDDDEVDLIQTARRHVKGLGSTLDKIERLRTGKSTAQAKEDASQQKA